MYQYREVAGGFWGGEAPATRVAACVVLCLFVFVCVCLCLVLVCCFVFIFCFVVERLVVGCFVVERFFVCLLVGLCC